jgi:hypothetical protein
LAGRGRAFGSVARDGLFTGTSGTGEIMAAKILASDLELDLFRIDLSVAVDSQSRYANVEIDYLRQRMEECSGIVVLATNLKNNIDAALFGAFASSWAAIRPSAVPAATIRNPPPGTSRTTSPRAEPSAIRIPISGVRCATTYDITPCANAGSCEPQGPGRAASQAPSKSKTTKSTSPSHDTVPLIDVAGVPTVVPW